LGWRQEDLSKASGVGTATIQRIEKSGPPITGYVSTIVRIQAAFEDAEVMFIDDDETAGIGLRLTKKRKRQR
jgi:transcriptional regulator with XRE-family HTH domain